MTPNTINFFTAITVALISSYFGYIKLQKEFTFNKKKQTNEYLFEKYIKSGFDLIENYLSHLFYIVISNNTDESKGIKIPLYVIRSMDYRFNTDWMNSILLIESLIKESKKQVTGKPIPDDAKYLLESLIDEVLFFKRKQELNITASSTRLLYWNILNKVFRRRNRKKILLLTKNIVHLVESTKSEDDSI